jgi:hypothetical protein
MGGPPIMKKFILVAFSILLAAISILLLASQKPNAPAAAVAPVPRAEYIAYARASADWTWSHYDELIAKWKQTFDPKNVFGYRPPGYLLEMAVIYAHLYEQEKRPEYADRAKKVVLTYGDYRSEFPDWARKVRTDYVDAVPALPDFFTTARYIRAFDTLRRLGRLSPAEIARAESTIAESISYLLRTQEWGAMNRAALRAETLAWAVRALPRHPDVAKWEMQRRALGDDNWGTWEIEDAQIYHGVWLYALMGYADALGKFGEMFRTPEMYYYAHYFLNLMDPAGMIPDFGDAHWEANWPHYLVFFEAAAKEYRDPALKWAAATIARKFIDFKNPTSVGLGFMLLDCVRWGGAESAAAPPSALSQEVMEDVQGKKIVFRDGWAPASTYALLNYRDEGDGGLNFRDYLRDSIPVEEEKMTHGHADENSIVLLMSGGSVLLHDAGYRDYMPSGPFGAFRQDYFHNRLCVRPEKFFMGQAAGEYRYSVRDAVPGQGILEFLRNSGSYRKVRTQKVDFLTLDDIDYSRTRMIDDNWGFASDRVVAYVKEAGAFVVFDIFKSLREDFFTLANLWHTRKIHARGDHWYDTGYDVISGAGGTPAKLPEDTRLLIAFPETHFKMEKVEPQKRHYQDELTISQATGQHFELGETVGFATVLLPHPAGTSPADLAAKIRLLPAEGPRDGMAVEIESGGKRYFVGVKNDLRMDMARDFKRPKYTYEAGRIRLGEFETNGDFLYASLAGQRLSYTIVNLTKAFFRGTLLHEAKPWLSGLAFDGSPDAPEQGKLRYWRDSVDIK